MNRRDFLKKLGTLAAAGALAPTVVELLPAPAATGYVFEWADGSTFSEDLHKAIEHCKAHTGMKPDTFVVRACNWDALVEALKESHPELHVEALRAAA